MDRIDGVDLQIAEQLREKMSAVLGGVLTRSNAVPQNSHSGGYARHPIQR